MVFPLFCVGRAGTDRRLSGESTRRKSEDFQARDLYDKASDSSTQNKLFLQVFIKFNAHI